MAPLTITFNDKDYKDRIDLQPSEFYNLLGSLDVLPTTAMPSPPEYIHIFEEAIKEGYTQILCINMSSGTSGSYNSAVIAKSIFFENNPENTTEIYIVDSKCMSHGSGYLLIKSAMLIEQGATFKQVIDFNESYKMNVKHLLSVDDLDNLIKSGRLTNVSAMIGKILKIKPIMSMRDGKGAIVAKIRGTNKVFSHYIEEFKKRNDPKLTDFVIIGYTSDRTKAENLKLKLTAETDFTGDIYIMQIGVSVGTHVGLGGLSFYFIEKGDRHDGLIFNEMSGLLDKKEQIIAMLQKFKNEKLKR
jgi:DegV family protein with EDD domain